MLRHPVQRGSHGRRGAPAEAGAEATEAGAEATRELVGKLEVIRLPGDAKRVLGYEFSLRWFHDYLWSNGNVPISLLRWEMFGDPSDIQAMDLGVGCQVLGVRVLAGLLGMSGVFECLAVS